MGSFTTPPEPIFVMKSDMTAVHCLLFEKFANKEHLYVGTTDGIIHIWDLETNRKTRTLEPSENTCLSLNFADNCLISQDKPGLIQIWTIEKSNFICIYSRNFSNLSFCKISVLIRNNIFVAVPQPSSKFNFYVWRGNDLEFLGCSKCTEIADKKLGDIMALKVIALPAIYVIIVYESGLIAFWDSTNKEIVFHEQITTDTPMCLDFDCKNLQGICGTSGKNMVAFKLENVMKIRKKKEITITNAGVGSVCIRPDGKILAVGCWDGRIRIFSWKTLKLLVILDCHVETVLDVRFSLEPINNKYLLAAGSNDKSVSLWDIYN